MTYNIEIREETNKTKCTMRVAEMKSLRTKVEKTRRGYPGATWSAGHGLMGNTEKETGVQPRKEDGGKLSTMYRVGRKASRY